MATTRPVDAERDLSETRRIVLAALERYRTKVWRVGGPSSGTI